MAKLKGIERALARARYPTDDRSPDYKTPQSRNKPRGGRGSQRLYRRRGLFETIGNHKLVTAVAVLAGAGAIKYGFPVVAEYCNSHPSAKCSSTAAINDKTKLIESAALFGSADPKSQVRGVGMYAISGIRLDVKANLIQIKTTLNVDPAKVAAIGQMTHAPEDPKQINLTNYISKLCDTVKPNPQLIAAGTADLNNIVSEATQHADALVPANDVVTPDMIRSANNGYATKHSPAKPSLVVLDTVTNLVVNCVPIPAG